MMEGENTPIVFGEWLKRRRKAADMTQDELAKRAGCSVGALRKIESGERRPSKQLAALLAQALELSEEDQLTFVRVARGDLNLERLPLSGLPAALPGLAMLQQAQESTFPRTGGNPASSIPGQSATLIGREAELVALERMFQDPECRLLTLTGVGGIGKTRLAIEFASRMLSAFPGGVFYVPLTPVNSPEKVISAIAEVLDFGFSGPNDPKEQLLNYISACFKEDVLFIFDNLEHLLAQTSTDGVKAGLPELVWEILQRLPNVKILGTSRERLNLHGEWIYELHGLSIPPINYLGQLEAYKSILLFVNRAQRVRAGFHITTENQGPLIQICRLVEGVPLAIELAAAWTNLLSCREIAQEIQSNMDFLSTSMRDVPERHRSIRATFDHSWKLLSDEERRALCKLSVFHGGFDRHAAHQVAGATLSLLASLSDKSLVRRTGQGRYDLHEVIRQYALSHLNDQPEFLDAYDHHCEYYLKMVMSCEQSLKSALQGEAIRHLSGEIDNVRAAWTWAISHKNYARLNQAGRAFGWYFEITGLYQEGIEHLEPLVQSLRSEPQPDPWRRLLGLALIHQGLLFFRKGDFDQARVLYEESLVLLRPIGDSVLLADASIFLGTILHLHGDFARSKSFLEEGLSFARAGSDPWFEAYAIYNLGYFDSLMGRLSEGYEQMIAGLHMFRALGDPHAIALALNFIVPTLNKLGQYQAAKAFMRESINLCELSKNRWGMGTAYSYLGLTCIARGDYECAKTQLLKSLAIFEEYITGWNIARSYTYLGDASRMAGDFAEARQYYQKALHLAVEAKALPIAMDALWGLSYLLDQSGKSHAALMLCCYILRHPSSEEETKVRTESFCADLETKFSQEQITASRTSALSMSLDEIREIALELA